MEETKSHFYSNITGKMVELSCRKVFTYQSNTTRLLCKGVLSLFGIFPYSLSLIIYSLSLILCDAEGWIPEHNLAFFVHSPYLHPQKNRIPPGELLCRKIIIFPSHFLLSLLYWMIVKFCKGRCLCGRSSKQCNFYFVVILGFFLFAKKKSENSC